MTTNHEIGKKGENLAKEYLAERDYTILARNFRYKKSEIDLIAKRDKTLVFIEVKVRNRNDFGFPEEFVSENQIEKIHEAATQFILDHEWRDHIRFDIVAIQFSGTDHYKIDHIIDAF